MRPALLTLTLVFGCGTTDVGSPCAMVRRDPVTGATVPLLQREVPASTGTLLSLVSECEDAVCIQSPRFVPPATRDDAQVVGYCSRPCVPTPGSCDVGEGSVRFTCGQALLDEATLISVCSGSQEACAQLGGIRSPYFCVRSNP